MSGRLEDVREGAMQMTDLGLEGAQGEGGGVTGRQTFHQVVNFVNTSASNADHG